MSQQIASKEINQQVARIADEDRFVEQLSKIWLRHQKKDLEVRFKLGKMLNEKLGTPDERQQYGEKIIPRISKELAIDKSDISRLRHFAALSGSIAEFRKEHADATNWTRVRRLLSKSSGSPVPKPESRNSDRLRRSIESMVTKLQSDDLKLDEADAGQELAAALRKLFELAQAKLGVKFD